MQKKVKKVLEEVAEKHGIEYKVVEKIYKATYQTVEKALREMKNVRLILLGKFVINWKALEKNTQITKNFAKDERYADVRNREGWKEPPGLFDEQT